MPIQTLGKGAEQAIVEIQNEDITEAIKDLTTGTIGPVSGLPIKQVFDIAEGATDISEGETFRGSLKMMGWSPFLVDKGLDEF